MIPFSNSAARTPEIRLVSRRPSNPVELCDPRPLPADDSWVDCPDVEVVSEQVAVSGVVDPCITSSFLVDLL